MYKLYINILISSDSVDQIKLSCFYKMTKSCSNILCAKTVSTSEKFVDLFLDNQFSRLISKYGNDVIVTIPDSTGIIPYSGKYSLSELTIQNYVRFLSHGKIRGFVDSHEGNCCKVLIMVKVRQQNKRTLDVPFFPTPFELTYYFTLVFNCKKLDTVNIDFNGSALSIFYQYNTSPDPNGLYNKYEWLAAVGMDEATTENPLTFGCAAEQGFQTVIGLTAEQAAEYKAAAIQWFLTRFGIDFTNGIDVGNCILATPDFTAVMTPIMASGRYRVIESNNPLIPTLDLNNPPIVTLLEYAVTFIVANPTPVYYSGTYAANHPNGQVLSNKGDDLAFGIYKIVAPETVFGPERVHIVYMRSNFPGHSDYIDGIPSDPAAHSIEHFDLYSGEFGPGSSTLDVAVDQTSTPFRTLFRQLWAFPGSFVIPYYNTFVAPPIAFP